MKKLFLLGSSMLLIAGCGTTAPVSVKDTFSEPINILADSEVIVMSSEYRFVFPETDGYMDFEYSDGFAVEQGEGNIVFKLFDGDIIFDYDNEEPAFSVSDGEIYSGDGWSGLHKSGQIIFTTPDEMYHVLVSGEDEILKMFVDGMRMGK